jgi:hypothetical protein
MRYRLTDVGEIGNLINQATEARAHARRARDAEALAAAVRAQLQARRRAGAVLETGVAVPSLYIGDDAAAAYCVALARMTDKRFEKRVQKAVGEAVRAMTRSRPWEPASPIRMIISPWVRDADGCLSRTLTAEGEKTVLKGESFNSDEPITARP